MKESKEQSEDRNCYCVQPMKSSSTRTTRRYRIMRQLGLMPPIGSPFAPPNFSDDQKKVPFKRIFSERDEIHLLRAIISMATISDSPSPQISTSTLYNRIGDCLSCAITRSQLMNKVCKLRQRYHKQVSTNAQIKNPHEQEVFEMSRKIWGGELANQRSLNNESSSMALTKETSIRDLEIKYPHLMEEASLLPAMVKNGLQRLNSLELERLNERWRLQQIEEANALSKRERE